MFGERKIWKQLLVVAFAFRLMFVVRFSYLHPDEHLQGPQEIAHGIFGWAAQTPWEFNPENPIRSFVPLWILYGIPMSFFSADTDPVYVLYMLRALFAALTWVLEDMAVDRLVTTRNDKLRCLFFVGTSYATLTWQAHTLSNSVETVLVLWYLVTLYETETAVAAFQSPFDRHYDNALLALLLTLGTFNRPTFALFLILPSLRLLRFWYRYPSTFITFTFVAILSSSACIYVDTLLYGSPTWVMTPLNFIIYNSSAENLSAHGVHSRLTHLFASLPQLLGPGLLLLRPDWSSLPVQTIISALVSLSMIPHQEARFLLPLVPLFCSQMHLEQFKSAKVRNIMLTLWLSFNLTLGIIMGAFHQAGVIPAEVELRRLELPQVVVWWKTYSPPLWVSGLQQSEVDFVNLFDASSGEEIDEMVTFLDAYDENKNDKLTVLDVQGANATVLRTVLSASPRNETILIAPLAVISQIKPYLSSLPEPLWQTRLHIGLEQFDISSPSTWRPGLGMWRVPAKILL